VKAPHQLATFGAMERRHGQAMAEAFIWGLFMARSDRMPRPGIAVNNGKMK